MTAKATDLPVELVPLTKLKPDPKNARRHNARNLAAIVASLRRFGQRKPLVVSRNFTVVAGNGTLEAAPKAGLTELWVTVFPGTAAEARAFAIADNRTAELAEWDDGELLSALLALDDPLRIAAGFDQSDIDRMIAAASPLPHPGTADPNDVPDAPRRPISKPGDVWVLGDHRLMCGDCRNAEHVDRLLDGATLNLAFTSPPYAEQRQYDDTSGFRPIPPAEYVDWFADVQDNVRRHMAADGSWFVNIKPNAEGLDTSLYVLDLVIAHVRTWGWHFATEFCWERNGVPKNVTRRFKNQFEPVYQFALGDWKMRPEAVQHHSDNVPIAGGPGVGNTSWANDQGGNGPMFGAAKKRAHGTRGGGGESHQGTNWQPGEFIEPGMAYPGNRLPTFSGSHEATGHTAAFPVGLPSWFIRAYTDPNDTVYDPFTGSGSTILGAHDLGRRGYGMEISPAYVDIACRRWQRYTGIRPIRDNTGREVSFD